MNIINKKFNKNCPGWGENSEFNMLYLKTQQQFFADKFKAQGYLFVRDIYESLGIAVTKESCELGWHKNRGDIVNVLFGFDQIEGTNDFELGFVCYPILDYFDKEDTAE